MQLRELTAFSEPAVRALLKEYVDSLPFDISYQRFDEELAALEKFYAPSARGAFLVAEEGGVLAGCVALKRLDERTCEMKRLYVRPVFRGKKAGRLLVEAIVQKAAALGYRTMKLDTHERAHATAIALYRKLGFRETKAYHVIPHELLFLELNLDPFKTSHMPTRTLPPFRKLISEDLAIIEFEPQCAQAFRELNVAWITRTFVMEASDQAVLGDPYTHILDPGGAILLAQSRGQIVGTCALTYEGHGIYELTKMAVDENFRGQKIGWHLGVATLEKARQLGAKKVLLHSNRKGSAPAIRLYHKLGFMEIPLGNAPWARADIKMEITLL